ncbi:MAG: hypothetical protein JXA13_04770 [Anaerolineales bacterium]|nr:hypothetical protein [Anaerolineales bacterium]
MDFFERLIYALTETHPLHAMVVHFPIALTGAAAFFILLSLARKTNRNLEQTAFANIALAAVSIIAAGITGLRDNMLYYGNQAPNTGSKIILASILLVITSTTALVRWRKQDLFEQSPGKILYVSAYIVSFILALVLGFLGGVILYGF